MICWGLWNERKRVKKTAKRIWHCYQRIEFTTQCWSRHCQQIGGYQQIIERKRRKTTRSRKEDRHSPQKESKVVPLSLSLYLVLSISPSLNLLFPHFLIFDLPFYTTTVWKLKTTKKLNFQFSLMKNFNAILSTICK
jgi:hypothetical protein